MSTPHTEAKTDSVLGQIRTTRNAEGVSVLTVGTADVPLKLREAEGATALLVSFHGAIDRKTREIPSFPAIYGALNRTAHQLCLSDPAMLLPGEFGLAWYAGYEGLPLQTLLPEKITRLAQDLDVDRIVFFGSSGGGFAALFYAHQIKDSVSVVVNPQTNIFKYYANHKTRYREGCWPSLSEDEQLKDVICTNVCDLYAAGFQNTVIYNQSSGDEYHLMNHLAPLLSAVSGTREPRFVLTCDFHGRLRHSGSVPSTAFLPWLKTAILSETLDPDDLLMTHHDLTQGTAAPTAAKLTPSGTGAFDAGDLRRADMLRDYHLRQSKGA